MIQWVLTYYTYYWRFYEYDIYEFDTVCIEHLVAIKSQLVSQSRIFICSDRICRIFKGESLMLATTEIIVLIILNSEKLSMSIDNGDSVTECNKKEKNMCMEINRLRFLFSDSLFILLFYFEYFWLLTYFYYDYNLYSYGANSIFNVWYFLLPHLK